MVDNYIEQAVNSINLRQSALGMAAASA